MVLPARRSAENRLFPVWSGMAKHGQGDPACGLRVAPPKTLNTRRLAGHVAEKENGCEREAASHNEPCVDLPGNNKSPSDRLNPGIKRLPAILKSM